MSVWQQLLCERSFCFQFWCRTLVSFFFFFFNDTATTEIYTLSLHDALPISPGSPAAWPPCSCAGSCSARSEEHTSELQSRRDLVCRLLLEKKKKKYLESISIKRDQHKLKDPRTAQTG